MKDEKMTIDMACKGDQMASNANENKVGTIIYHNALSSVCEVNDCPYLFSFVADFIIS